MRILLATTTVFTGFAAIALAAPLTIHLHSTVPSPQPVGTVIGLAPQTENVAGMQTFRYSVSVNGGPFRVIRDFSQQREFAWAPELYEHKAVVRVTVRSNASKETADGDVPFDIVSRVAKSKGPAVSRTVHPLVALFSAPPCAEGGTFRVAFGPAGGESLMRTPSQPCRAAVSSNVLVAGMRADTDYRMRAEWSNGKTSGWMAFHTGLSDGDFPPAEVVVPRIGGPAATEPILIYSSTTLGNLKRSIATDLQGRMVWYSALPGLITRVLPGGRFLMGGEGANSSNSMRAEQLLREMDLAGNIVRETNASRVAEQLESRGIHSDCKIGGKECLSGFHHEAIRLPNGHTLAIAGLERMMPAGTQGSKEPVDVLGDVVVDLDEEFQVAGVWNTFDHLDITRKSYEDAKCRTGGGGCPPVMLAAEANGWTHSNSLNYIPSTGDFLISIPEQDWVVKVDWKNGTGSGKILWRLGRGGDFKAIAKAADPWFSYAHDPGFEPVGSNLLTLSDDGHIFFAKDQNFQTRAQIWKLDEEKRVAELVYQADSGKHSICCGSMQNLKNGTYHSVAGWIDPASPRGRSAETDKDGKTVYAIELHGVIVYRSFRVDDMYTVPVK